MVKDLDALMLCYANSLAKALRHFRYSAQKVTQLSSDPSQLDDEALEIWESFAARHARVVDLFLTKYVRVRVLREDPGFTGSLRDFVNAGEKLGIVDSADEWMALRELRNVIVHDYSEGETAKFFEALRKSAPRLSSVEQVIDAIK